MTSLSFFLSVSPVTLRRRMPVPSLLCVGVACLALAACGGPEAPAPAASAPAAVAAPALREGRVHFPAGHAQLALLASAEARPLSNAALELPARLVWNEARTQRVTSAFAGKVSAIRVDLGQSVRAGQALAVLASPDFGQAQADAAKAQADHLLAQRALQRQRELFDAGIVARKDLEQAQADASRAEAEVARAQARTRLYGGGTAVNQQLAITSAMDGVVVERNVGPGLEVRPDASGPGSPALFVVSDPTSLWVQIEAREAQLGALRPGQAFTLDIPAYPGESFTGRITAVSDTIDPVTRSIRVRGEVPNANRRLKAEMLATVRIQDTRERRGVLVPAQAIALRGGKHTVFVETAPGVFEPRRVAVGHEGPRDALVTEGLSAGEKVVHQNVLLLERQFHSLSEQAAAGAGGAAQ